MQNCGAEVVGAERHDWGATADAEGFNERGNVIRQNHGRIAHEHDVPRVVKLRQCNMQRVQQQVRAFAAEENYVR